MDPITLAILGIVGAGVAYFTLRKTTPAVQVIKGLSQGSANYPAGTPIGVGVAVLPNLPTPYSAGVGQNVANASTGYVAPTVMTASPDGTLQIPTMIITPGGAATTIVKTNQDVQNALNTLGYGPLTVDGVIALGDNPTHNAITKFRNDHGGPSGSLNDSLSKALAALGTNVNAAGPAMASSGVPPMGVGPTMQQGSSGANVVALQQYLNRLGAAPALTTDGSYGPATQAAVMAFQAHHALTADGIAGPQTQGAINLALTG